MTLDRSVEDESWSQIWQSLEWIQEAAAQGRTTGFSELVSGLRERLADLSVECSARQEVIVRQAADEIILDRRAEDLESDLTSERASLNECWKRHEALSSEVQRRGKELDKVLKRQFALHRSLSAAHTEARKSTLSPTGRHRGPSPRSSRKLEPSMGSGSERDVDAARRAANEAASIVNRLREASLRRDKVADPTSEPSSPQRKTVAYGGASVDTDVPAEGVGLDKRQRGPDGDLAGSDPIKPRRGFPKIVGRRVENRPSGAPRDVLSSSAKPRPATSRGMQRPDSAVEDGTESAGGSLRVPRKWPSRCSPPVPQRPISRNLAASGTQHQHLLTPALMSPAQQCAGARESPAVSPVSRSVHSVQQIPGYVFSQCSTAPWESPAQSPSPSHSPVPMRPLLSMVAPQRAPLRGRSRSPTEVMAAPCPTTVLSNPGSPPRTHCALTTTAPWRAQVNSSPGSLSLQPAPMTPARAQHERSGQQPVERGVLSSTASSPAFLSETRLGSPERVLSPTRPPHRQTRAPVDATTEAHCGARQILPPSLPQTARGGVPPTPPRTSARAFSGSGSSANVPAQVGVFSREACQGGMRLKTVQRAVSPDSGQVLGALRWDAQASPGRDAVVKRATTRSNSPTQQVTGRERISYCASAR